MKAYKNSERGANMSPTHNMSLEVYREQALADELKKARLYAIASDGDYLEAERDR